MKNNLQKLKKKAQELAYEDVSAMDIRTTSEGKAALKERFEYHLERMNTKK